MPPWSAPSWLCSSFFSSIYWVSSSLFLVSLIGLTSDSALGVNSFLFSSMKLFSCSYNLSKSNRRFLSSSPAAGFALRISTACRLSRSSAKSSFSCVSLSLSSSVNGLYLTSPIFLISASLTYTSFLGSSFFSVQLSAPALAFAASVGLLLSAGLLVAAAGCATGFF